MKIQKSVTVLTMISFVLSITSCSAKKTIFEEVNDLRKESRELKSKERLDRARSLRDKFPESILGNVSYLKEVDAIGLVPLEIKKIKNKDLKAYLTMRSETFSLGYLPADKNKEKEIVKELEAFLEKKPSLQKEGWFDILNITYDKEIRARVSKKLLGKDKNSLLFLQKYVSSLDPIKNTEEIVTYCRKELSKSTPDLSLCSNLRGLKNSEDEKKSSAYSDIIQRVKEKGLSTKDLELSKKVYTFLYRFDEEKAYEEIAAKVVKSDKNWVPIKVYADYFGIDNYTDFLDLSKLFKLSREPDFDERVEKVLRVANNKDKSLIVRAEAFSRLSSFYKNPANLNDDLAFKYMKEAYELRADNKSFAMSFVDYGLDQGVSQDKLWQALNQSEEAFNKEKAASLTHDKPLFGEEEDFRSSLEYLKGRLYLKDDKVTEAHTAFLASFAFKEAPMPAFYLGKLLRKDHPLKSFKWFLKAKLHDDNELDKKELSEIEENVLSIAKNSYSKNLTFEEIFTAFSEKENKENGKKEEEEKKHPLIGKDFIKSPLKGVDGIDYDWTQLKGKKVILSFWATWCTPCFAEMAVLNKMIKEKKIKNLKVVGICTDGIANRRKVEKIMKKSDIQYDIVLDNGDYQSKYDVAAIPANFFVGEDGKIISNETGYSPRLEELIIKQFK